MKVQLIDAFKFRNESLKYQEFGGWASHIDFPDVIPEGEVWMDVTASEVDQSYWHIAAEAEEKALNNGLSEDDAYDYALAVERSARNKEELGGEGHRPEHDEVLQGIYVNSYGSLDVDGEETIVWLVNGELIRGVYKSDWVEGGNAAEYTWQPIDEIWIDSRTNPDEIPFIVLHELTEREIMKANEMGYEHAHDEASKAEFEARKKYLETGEKSGPLINTGWMRPAPTITATGVRKETRKTSSFSDKKLDINTPAERAKKVDLIRSPEKVKHCGNCKFISEGYCYHPEVDLPIDSIDDPEVLCCALWDHEGVERVADELSGQKALSAYNGLTGGSLVPTPEVGGPDLTQVGLPTEFGRSKLPLTPMEEERGQRSLLMAPQTGQKDIRKKYRKKGKNGWVTIRGCPCFVEDGVITKGPKGLVGKKDITPQWEENEDNYRGIRSLKTLRQKYKASYFSECERDELGYCLPSGQVGQQKPEKVSSTEQPKVKPKPKYRPKPKVSKDSAKGKSMAKMYFRSDLSAISAASQAKEADRILGKRGSHREVPSLMGAPDDAEVSVYAVSGTIEVTVYHENFKAVRVIERDSKGNLRIYNKYFSVAIRYQRAGIGADVFARQVENAIKNGVKYIKCYAARADDMNGYYTWPRFGYDQSLDTLGYTRTMREEITSLFPGANTVLDIMETPEGRAWWKNDGREMEEAVFDLSEGSRSRKVLDSYLKERDARKSQQKGLNQTIPSEQSYEDITLSPEQEKWLDAAERKRDQYNPQMEKKQDIMVKTLRTKYKWVPAIFKEEGFDVEVLEVDSGRGWRSIVKKAGVVLHSTPVKGSQDDARSDAIQWIRTGIVAVQG